MSEHQMIRHRCTRATMRTGALLLLPQLLLQVQPAQVPPFPSHRTVAVMKMLDASRRHITGMPIRFIDGLRPLANRSLKTTTTRTLRTKTTSKTKTKTIVAICPIQVPVPSPPSQPTTSNNPL